MSKLKRFIKILSIEGKIAIRGVDTIFFGILMPVCIALLIGMIKPDMVQASFGALITVGICATAFMGIPLGLADYRDKKILKHYYVTPVSPGMILLVHVTICMIMAFLSSVCVYFAMKIFFGYQMMGSVGGFLLSYLLVMAAMYGLGMVMASLCKSVKIANLVCSIVYFPMLFLSGATIPYEIFPRPIQTVANVMPLTQGIKLLKGYSMGTPQESLMMPFLLMIAVAAVSIILSIRLFRFE